MVVKVFVLGDTVTVDATWLTVTEAVALSEPDVAVIVAVPSATEVTNPAVETVAMVVSDEAHETVAPAIVLSLASFTVAVSCVVSASEANVSTVSDLSLIHI